MILLTGWLQWIEDSSLSKAIRQSTWLYPTLEIIHIIGIAVLVGAAFLFDLRLLGVSKTLSVVGLANHLLPWARRALILIIPSGILLFATNAVTLAFDPVFWAKIILLIVAALNAGYFHRYTMPSNANWNVNQSTPTKARTAAIISIVMWISIIACGRLLAY